MADTKTPGFNYISKSKEKDYRWNEVRSACRHFLAEHEGLSREQPLIPSIKLPTLSSPTTRGRDVRESDVYYNIVPIAKTICKHTWRANSATKAIMLSIGYQEGNSVLLQSNIPWSGKEYTLFQALGEGSAEDAGRRGVEESR